MAGYNEQAFDFAMFEPRVAVQQQVAPIHKKEKAIPRILEKPEKSREELIKERKETRRQTFAVLSVLAVLLSFIALHVYSRVCLDEVTMEISNLKETLAISESENVRMTMELNSKVTLDKVETYAVEKLGMVKLESYQIKYIDVSDENEVLLSSGKKVGTDNRKTTFKQLLAYIF